MPDDLDRLRDVPAAFPRPDRAVTERARRRALGSGSRPPRRRLGLIAAAAVFAAAVVGFTAGYLFRPTSAGSATSISFDVKPRQSEAWFASVNAFGAVANGKSGEEVVVESRECDGYGQWSTATQVVTGNGGTWIAQVGPTSTARLRARWKDSTSNSVTVRVRPHLELIGPHGGVFQLRVAAGRFFERATGVLQRRAGTRWLRVRTFRLHRSPGGMGQVPWTYATFRASVKKGTFVRVVLPQSQVGRCYLPGASNIVRV